MLTEIGGIVCMFVPMAGILLVPCLIVLLIFKSLIKFMS